MEEKNTFPFWKFLWGIFLFSMFNSTLETWTWPEKSAFFCYCCFYESTSCAFLAICASWPWFVFNKIALWDRFSLGLNPSRILWYQLSVSVGVYHWPTYYVDLSDLVRFPVQYRTLNKDISLSDELQNEGYLSCPASSIWPLHRLKKYRQWTLL